MGDTTTADLLARLEAMAARLDEQTARVTRVEADNIAQSTRITILEYENARLRETTAVITPIEAAVDTSEPKLKRRGMLRKALGATAAAALLAVSRDAATASAGTRTTVAVGGSTDTYGLLSTNGTGDPIGYLPNLNGRFFGVIGSRADSGLPAPVDAGVFGSGGSSSGVLGLSDVGKGVFGAAIADNGVRGESVNGIAVYGLSINNFGTTGVAYKTGYAGLFGYGGTAGAVGLFAQSVPGGTAAYLVGAVTVSGNFQVVGGAKNALVPHPDGSHRRMYCQEATEPWFEDFGTAQLVNGQASVPLDPDFDALVKGDDYRVFLTEIGDCGGLYVSRKGPHQFIVRSRAGAAASGSFDYRVVSRRKEDVGKRLEKVDLPKLAPIDHERLIRPASSPAGGRR